MIYIAADHRGFQLKKYLNAYLHSQLKVDFEDLGAQTLDPDDDASDFAIKVAKKVAKDQASRGILICWTGHAMCMTANKFKGVRAISGHSIESAEMGRKHTDANILCLASKFLTDDHAAAIVKKFIETDFDGAKRLLRRLEKVNKLPE